MSNRQNSDPTRLHLSDQAYEFMEKLADCIPVALSVIDWNGCVVIWNSAAEDLYGIKHAEIIHRHIGKFFPTSLIDQVRLSRESRDNVHNSPREGTHVVSSARPLFIDAEFMGVVSSDTDYAESKRLFNQLEDAHTKLLFLENEVKRASARFGNIVGASATLMKRIELAKQIAPTVTNVLITGESGTGKELFARGIHDLSGRKGMFVPVNCGAVPAELFEAEFFGYAPGAFTGASKQGKVGFFEMANGGTIFLDEIGDMPLFIQAKILRALQEREIMRVGGEEMVALDVRVISATSRDLTELMESKAFRKDLFYRLNVVEIALPPLRERKHDIPPLIDHFVTLFSKKNGKRIKRVSPEVMDLLCNYSWPGNIRELMNLSENMVVTGGGAVIKLQHVPPCLLSTGAPAARREGNLDLVAATRELEIESISEALSRCGNNKSKAASILNIPRATLYHKMATYGL